MYDKASTEPIDIILANECGGYLNLTTERFRALANEIERLQAWVSDLQSGMYINCVYCGHRYGPGETTPVSMADALKAHIETCPKHPMSALRRVLKAIEGKLYGDGSGDGAILCMIHDALKEK